MELDFLLNPVVMYRAVVTDFNSMKTLCKRSHTRVSPCVVFLKLIEYIDRYYYIDRYKRSFVVNDLLRGCHENASQEG